ncbi:IS66 family insertion sequence element accessory protein TnpB [Mesorhizobium sp. M0715]|uniref:IS66 family insertion sequence element accessory protein TnpB n=1 Tax=Mesorhizobium sp. M0715 TaxID=2956990 RepID=UPI0033375BD5
MHREPIDFRAVINSLAIVVEQSMGLNPFERAVFAFCNRRRDRIKLLFYDRSGFLMVLKRLQENKFHWPRRQQAVLTLTTEQLHWLLETSTSRRFAGTPSAARADNLWRARGGVIGSFGMAVADDAAKCMRSLLTWPYGFDPRMR